MSIDGQRIPEHHSDNIKKTLTKDDVQENWDEVERETIQLHFSFSGGEWQYSDIIRRVQDWLLSETSIRKIGFSTIENFIRSRRTDIEIYLSKLFIVPSSPLLKYGGTLQKKNYFSSTILDPFEVEDLLSDIFSSNTSFGSRLPDTIISKEDLLDFYQTLERQGTSLSDGGDSCFSLMVPEDSHLFLESLTTKRPSGVSLYIKVNHQEDNENVLLFLATETHKRNTIGVLFNDNLRENTISDVSSLEHIGPSPGYIGEKTNISCPSFYINLAEIMKNSHNYEDYLKKVYNASFYATVLANITLFQEEGYLNENTYGYISEKIRENTLKYRPILISLCSFHGALILCDIDYESDVAFQILEESQSALTLGSMKASAQWMLLATKKERIPYSLEPMRAIAQLSNEKIRDYFPNDLLFSINEALREHGCLFNSITTGQTIDRHISLLTHSSSYGLSPISSIETSYIKQGGEKILLFPLELFDHNGRMTCDLQQLSTQTLTHISPRHQIRINATVQKFCPVGVHTPIFCPEEMTVSDFVDLYTFARSQGLKTVTLIRGHFKQVDCSMIIKEEKRFMPTAKIYVIPEFGRIALGKDAEEVFVTAGNDSMPESLFDTVPTAAQSQEYLIRTIIKSLITLQQKEYFCKQGFSFQDQHFESIVQLISHLVTMHFKREG